MNNPVTLTSNSMNKDKMVMLMLTCLLIGVLCTSSIIGGYPRKDSEGPYKSRTLNYASEYDIAALEFIKNKFENKTDKPFIVGDVYTNAPAVVTLGYINKVAEGKSVLVIVVFSKRRRVE